MYTSNVYYHLHVTPNYRSTRRITTRRAGRPRQGQGAADVAEETTPEKNETEMETDADVAESNGESVCVVVQTRRVSLVMPVTV